MLLTGVLRSEKRNTLVTEWCQIAFCNRRYIIHIAFAIALAIVEMQRPFLGLDFSAVLLAGLGIENHP